MLKTCNHIKIFSDWPRPKFAFGQMVQWEEESGEKVEHFKGIILGATYVPWKDAVGGAMWEYTIHLSTPAPNAKPLSISNIYPFGIREKALKLVEQVPGESAKKEALATKLIVKSLVKQLRPRERLELIREMLDRIELECCKSAASIAENAAANAALN